MIPYVVRAGDRLDLIAYRHDVSGNEVWNHPQNGPLKKKRGNPSILCSGDVLYIPKSERKWLPVSTGKANVYVATVPTTSVSVTFAVQGKPLSGKKCIVRGLPPPNELTTDGNAPDPRGSGSNSRAPVKRSTAARRASGQKTRQTIFIVDGMASLFGRPQTCATMRARRHAARPDSSSR
jgi:hypothetical protein